MPYGGVEFNENSAQKSLTAKRESIKDSKMPYGGD
jgi:hypothetical protein